MAVNSLDKLGLFSAASNAARVFLERAPIKVLPLSSDVPGDPRRLLGGSALAPTDIQAFAVRRRVYIESLKQETDLEGLSSWLAGQTEKTLLLIAETGEGKTTFTNLLLNPLRDKFITLEWDIDNLRPLNHHDLRIFHNIVRTFLPPEVVDDLAPQEPTLIVIGEIPAGLSGSTSDHICSSLVKRASSPDPSVVLIVGRPAELQPILYGISAEIIRLLPINLEEADELCSNLRKAYSELISRGISGTELEERYPNLFRFLELPRSNQIKLFLESKKPLIAALLQAVYGEDSWKRLKKEFDSLKQAEKNAYMHICLASSAGKPVPEQLLRWLAPDAQVESHCQYNPWVRIDGSHVARHKVIAQTVIEESGANTLLMECLGKWLDCFEKTEISPLLVWRIFNQIAEWQPVTPERKQSRSFKGLIKRLARQALSERKDFISHLIRHAENDERHVIQWAATIHELLPDRLGEKDLYLLGAIRTLLEKVMSTTVDTSLKQRGQYYLDKNERDTRKAKNQPEDIGQLSVRIKSWNQIMGERRWEPDFFTDLFLDANSLARILTVGPERTNLDSEQLLEAYMVAALAFENLRLRSGYNERCRQLDIGVYSELISRLLYYALPTKKIKVLQAAWEVSAKTQNPNAKTGIQYAKLLPPEDARVVLISIIDKHPEWGEAHYELSSLAQTESQRNEARKSIEAGFAAKPSGLSLAMLNHAAAVVAQNLSEREKFLRLSVQGYHAYIKTVGFTEERAIRAPLLRKACQELGKVTKDLPPECMDGGKKSV